MATRGVSLVPAGMIVERTEDDGERVAIWVRSKGAWGHALISFVLALLTFGLSWIVYAFASRSIIRTMYLRRGWVEWNSGEY